jgi:hypothetical protein
MRPIRPGALLSGALLAAATLGAQRPGQRLPFGLVAGRHDVSVRTLSNGGRASTAWYPTACGRRPAVPANPCRNSAPDSGRSPLLILGSAGRAVEDTARGLYFASHGYVVVLGGGFAEALDVGRTLPFVDTTQIVVAGAGATSVPGARAMVELDPASTPGRAVIPTLIWGPVRTDSSGSSWFVDLPPGPADRFRLVSAVTHAFFDAALGRGSLPVAGLVGRLRRSGLVTR